MSQPRVLITGASGYLGRLLTVALAGAEQRPGVIVATDVRESDAATRLPGVVYARHDVRETGLDALLRLHGIDTVVHLAAIVTPGPASNRELEYAVDVTGTQRVLEACVAAGVRRLIVTSSGAAYGYHPDNPGWITEDQPLRGNPEFAYAHHKRIVEGLLADARRDHPALEQVVLRVGTIVGETTANQITALFERKRLLKIAGSASPFVFIWDHDVAAAIVHAVFGAPAGIYNLAGDGALTIDEIAARLGKPLLVLPAWLLAAALALAKPLGLTRYGPEQVRFLRWRPVLANARLKAQFGWQPSKTSAEAFDIWRLAAGRR